MPRPDPLIGHGSTEGRRAPPQCRVDEPASRARLADSPVSGLTPRELDVLREMAQGKANGGIASALFLSESAVEKHVHSIFSKLGLSEEPQLHRRVAAVLAYLRDPRVIAHEGGGATAL